MAEESRTGGGPLISLVCSTIGRPDALRRLLTSVAAAELAERVEFILVDQSPDQSCAALVDGFGLPGPHRVTTSGLGVSTGRNAGTPLARAPIVAYPDDNCWYPPGTFRSVIEKFAVRTDLSGVTGMQVTEAGVPSMLRWLPEPTTVTRRNFIRTSVSSTIFLRRDALPSPTPFDEGVGVGSPGRRGAGEESDLLLRLIASGHTVEYRPEIRVLQDDDRDQITAAFVDKMAKYGVGQGYLWRRHSLPVSALAYYSARKIAGAGVRAARGQTLHARADLAFVRGQVAGWLGVGG
ncbi:glycosyl transferase [Mycobacterium sp. IS-1496]|uniref:glycosyltransferase family 2 protein n=1 Tax=Mycobacterium sp. IS-1496 TaxID=1772284 RepID=UPI000741626F|nr:glycosyltransferase [Mycobacterium sp. IS-1496]KUI31173.1 glycosyl transferase [Mycobacterium sp. IS-1496]